MTPAHLRELKSLVTLELWEAPTQQANLPRSGQPMKVYLADARRFITEISPMLSLRLAQLAPRALAA